MLASCGATSTSSRAGKYSAFAMISWPSRLRMKSVSSMAACGCLAPLSTVREPDALGTGSMSCEFRRAFAGADQWMVGVDVDGDRVFAGDDAIDQRTGAA